jgi:hypothetical protein
MEGLPKSYPPGTSRRAAGVAKRPEEINAPTTPGFIVAPSADRERDAPK